MEWETLKIEGEGAIRHLVLNRPRIHNAVNAQVLRDIVGACAHLDGLSGCRVVILRGEGPSFCSGADLRDGMTDDTPTRDLISRARLGQRAIAALAGLVLVARNHFVSPSDLNFWESILYLCCIVLGGLGSVRGAIVGALAIGCMGELMRIGLPMISELIGIDIRLQVRYVLFGMVLILMMRYRPNGMLPVAEDEASRGRERVSDHRDVKATLFVLGDDRADS